MDSTNNEKLPRRRILAALAGGIGFAAANVAGVLPSGAAEVSKINDEQLHISLDRERGPLRIGRFGVGHGGYWDEPTWLDRASGEIRSLRSQTIRLFVTESYDLLPAPGKYNWSKLDKSVEMILRAGSKPLMCIIFKPRVLFPTLDQNVVTPNNWTAWQDLVFNLVKRYKENGSGIEYWEIGNEGDIGAQGGAPYKFTPENYTTYYQHTAAAIARADPDAYIGGPAVAHYTSALLPALVAYCDRTKTPIHFVSWHNYNSDPSTFTKSIAHIKKILAGHPSLKIETIIDEWNCSIGNPPLDPRFQPCFIAEVTYRMLEAGLDSSNFYHIRDYYVEPQVMTFLPWWNPESWNRISLMLGLFDFQNVPRPSYFLFRLLSRLRGNRIDINGSGAKIHGLGSYDDSMKSYNLLIWNFSDSPVRARLILSGVPEQLKGTRVALDSVIASNEEFHRLQPQPEFHVDKGEGTISADLEPFGVTSILLQKISRRAWG